MVTVEMRITARHRECPDVFQQGNLMRLQDPGKAGKIAGGVANGVDGCHIHDCRMLARSDENLLLINCFEESAAPGPDKSNLHSEFHWPRPVHSWSHRTALRFR